MSQKIGRNEPCPCGSGKKYKRCCLGKAVNNPILPQEEKPSIGRLSLTRYRQDLKDNPEALKKFSKKLSFKQFRRNFEAFIRKTWDIQKVRQMDTKEIIEKLKAMNVDFDIELFKKQALSHISAVRLAEEYYYTQNYNAKEEEEDFIWLAICELWRQLIPQRVNIEMLDELMQDGYKDMESRNHNEGIRKWSKAWDIIKAVVPSHIVSVAQADEFIPEPLTQSIFNWCQDFELELFNFGLENKKHIEKVIKYCREFCERFPQTNEGIIQNMLRSEAEAYALLGNIKKAEKLFEAIVERFPDNVWGYAGWGDMYSDDDLFGKKVIDYGRAEKIYKTALTKCSVDIDVIYERLDILKEKKEKYG